MCFPHSVDALFVCVLGFLDFQVTLCNLQVLEHLVVKTLLLGLDHLLGLDGEVCLHLLSNLVHALDTLSFDKLNHALHNKR